MKILSNCVFDWETCKLESADVIEYDGPVVQLKKNSNAPPPPDPNVVSSAQTRANRDTAAFNAALNRGNVTTPFGSQTFTFRGNDPNTGAPQWDELISLTPDAQALLDQQFQQNRQLGDIAGGMMDQVAGSYGRPMDTSRLPALRGDLNVQGPQLRSEIDTAGLPQLFGADDLEGARTQTQDALYRRQTAFLDPQWQQREQAFRTRMANQGVVEGSEAYRTALDDENRARSFDYGQARDSAIAGGGAELDRLSGISSRNRSQTFGERAAGAGFTNDARSQALSEAIARNEQSNRSRAQGMEELFALRNQPLNEFNALRSASPVDVPNFQSPSGGGVNPADVSGNIWNAYQGNLNIANANQASRNSSNTAWLSALASIAGAFILSDERTKDNVEKVGELPQGLGLYDFEYIGDPSHTRHTGVMAQEVERVQPDAVLEGRDGLKRVHYGKVLAEAMRRAG